MGRGRLEAGNREGEAAGREWGGGGRSREWETGGRRLGIVRGGREALENNIQIGARDGIG